MNFTFDPNPSREEVKNLVVNHHYSGYVPPNVQYSAGLRLGADLVAAIIFTVPATRWALPVLELARLVRRPDVRPSLTSLIGKAVKEIKRRKFDLVVSFADSTHGHHGGVYQAASWNFHEQRKPSCDGFFIDGVLVPRRTLNHRYGTSSVEKLPPLVRAEGKLCEPHFDKGKYLYWRALNAEGNRKAKALKLKALPYPKPAPKTIERELGEAFAKLFARGQS